MKTHTNSTAALAPPDRLTPEDLLLDVEARTIWHVVTDNRDVMRRVAGGPLRWVIYRLRRESNRSCPLEQIARIIVWLANAGVSEAKLRTIPLFITRVIEDCFAGSAHRSLDELDREKQAVAAKDMGLALNRRIDGLDSLAPEVLESEAAAAETEAAVDLEEAKLLRRTARQRRSRLLQFPARSLATS